MFSDRLASRVGLFHHLFYLLALRFAELEDLVQIRRLQRREVRARLLVGATENFDHLPQPPRDETQQMVRAIGYFGVGLVVVERGTADDAVGAPGDFPALSAPRSIKDCAKVWIAGQMEPALSERMA